MGYRVLPRKVCLAPDNDVILIHGVCSLYSSDISYAVRLAASAVPTAVLGEPSGKHQKKRQITFLNASLLVHFCGEPRRASPLQLLQMMVLLQIMVLLQMIVLLQMMVLLQMIVSPQTALESSGFALLQMMVFG